VIIEKQKAFSKIIILLLLFFVFLFTRFYNLSEAPVWEDNFSWLYRINYYPWIIENNLKGNPEEGEDLSYAGKISYHPGVTLMTFSGFTTRYGKKIISKIDTEYKPCAYNDYECPYLNVELLLAKIPIIFISSIAFFIIIYILSNNISLLSALIFGVIVLFEPIFVTTSRDLHLDFLQSILITLSFVILLFYSKQKELVFSGISFGLATLTRFISVMFVPSFLFIEVIFRKFEIKKVLLLFFSSFLFFCIMYPPMWVAPYKTASYMISGSLDSTKSHVQNDNNVGYFSGFLEFLSNDNDFELSTFWVLLFLTSLAYATFYLRKQVMVNYEILLFFTIYLLLLNISDKKFFRYLTPIIMGYSIFVSIVWSHIIHRLQVKYKTKREEFRLETK